MPVCLKRDKEKKNSFGFFSFFLISSLVFILCVETNEFINDFHPLLVYYIR